ncbi:hypothetical protein BX666DRAFT_1542104 [Dichotomocladium elegans]|nr:hypothetical protein BX666DRAFT_1542104 [Dichotomocladium elegans]
MAGIGHQGGFEKVESIVPINEQGTLNAFCDFGGQFQLSINASISAGPVGRSANISLAATRNANIGATYMYSSSKGAFAGYGIESIKISESVNTNAAFYGRPITAKDILAGEVETPPEASRLYGMLRSMGACKADFQLGVSQDTNPVASLSGEVSPQYQHAPPNNSAQSFEDTQHHVPHGNTVLHTQPCCSICDDGSMADPANGGGPPMNSYDAPQKEHIVVAVLPYVAETPEELSFEVGDRIVVTQSHENRDRWWDGAIGDSRGKFLANYTKDV